MNNDKNNKPNFLAELSPRDLEAQAERARTQIVKDAKKIKSKSVKNNKNISKRSILTKKQQNESYKRTIKRAQSELNLSDYLFSKIIHNKVVEKISDVLGATIARPNSILIGAFLSFTLTLMAYMISKNIGYKLSGSETIVAFILGWVIGIIYDYLKILFFGKSKD